MESKESIREVVLVLLASLILALAFSFKDHSALLISFLYFVIIIGCNILTKKIIGYYLEINVKTRSWSWYQYGFRKDAHFKSALPMIWVPLFFTLISQGYVKWFAILEFDVEAKTERVSRRHGLYRFTQVTEWHIAWIAVWGIIANIIIAILGYFAGFEVFTRLSIFYACWSLLPLSSLDGSKIFFASRGLWTTVALIVGLLTFWAMTIF